MNNDTKKSFVPQEAGKQSLTTYTKKRNSMNVNSTTHESLAEPDGFSLIFSPVLVTVGSITLSIS